MLGRIPFTYGEFSDVPRMIHFLLSGRGYLLRSFFLDEQDEYDDHYSVFDLPQMTEAELCADPGFFVTLRGRDPLGRIPVLEIGLDITRRQTLDGDAIGRWLANRSVATEDPS